VGELVAFGRTLAVGVGMHLEVGEGRGSGGMGLLTELVDGLDKVHLAKEKIISITTPDLPSPNFFESKFDQEEPAFCDSPPVKVTLSEPAIPRSPIKLPKTKKERKFRLSIPASSESSNSPSPRKVIFMS
jgi:hypothetical protein